MYLQLFLKLLYRPRQKTWAEMLPQWQFPKSRLFPSKSYNISTRLSLSKASLATRKTWGFYMTLREMDLSVRISIDFARINQIWLSSFRQQRERNSEGILARLLLMDGKKMKKLSYFQSIEAKSILLRKKELDMLFIIVIQLV